MGRRNVEQDITRSSGVSATVVYRNQDGSTASVSVTYGPETRTTGYYTTFEYRDSETGEKRTSDVLTKRVAQTRSVLAAVNPTLCKSYLENGFAPSLGDLAFSTTITELDIRIGPDGPETARETVDEYISSFAFAGGAGFQDYVINGEVVRLSGGPVHVSNTVTEYQVYRKSGITKTKVTRNLAWGTTAEGRDLVSAVISQAESAGEVAELINAMTQLISDGTTVQTVIGRDLGLQTRPSEQDEERDRIDRISRPDIVVSDDFAFEPPPDSDWEDIDFDFGVPDDGFTLPDPDDPVVIDLPDWDLPTTNPPGDPNPGDTWIDADTDIPNIWDGDDWVPVTPEPPESPEIGDKWIDAEIRIPSFWDGDNWTPYSPRPSDLTLADAGRIFFNPITNQLELWDGTDWIVYGDAEPDPTLATIGDRFIDADSGQEFIFDGDEFAPTENSWPPFTIDPPIDTATGDRWINRETNQLQTWDGAEWSDFPPFRPLDPAPGDTWVDPITETPEVWDGFDWNVYSEDPPAARAINDTWVQPSTGIQRQWDGADWVETGVEFGSTSASNIQLSGGATVRTTTVELPFANDDTLAAQRLSSTTWRQWVVPGGAQEQAIALGRLENAFRFGSAYGANVVVEAWNMPSEPLAPFTVRAGGLEVQYLVDGPAWEFDGDMIVASCDGILCGVTGRIEGQRVVPWVAAKVNLSNLPAVPAVSLDQDARPANTIPTPGNFRASRPGGVWNILPTNGTDSYEQAGTPAQVFPPFSVVEADRLISRSRLDEAEGVFTPVPDFEGIEELVSTTVMGEADLDRLVVRSVMEGTEETIESPLDEDELIQRALLGDLEFEPDELEPSVVLQEGDLLVPNATLDDVEIESDLIAPTPVLEGGEQTIEPAPSESDLLAPTPMLEGGEQTIEPELSNPGDQPLAFYLDTANIGAATDGGFFVGLISHTADGNATHALIAAPIIDGASGSGYPTSTTLRWKTVDTATAGTQSLFDGAANTAAIGAGHPAASFCQNLIINQYDDWYLPARYELDVAYHNLKPTTVNNSTAHGINPYSVPKRDINRTAGAPGQTVLATYQQGGSQAFGQTAHWSSTELADNNGRAWEVNFGTGAHLGVSKSAFRSVRAFRRIAL